MTGNIVVPEHFFRIAYNGAIYPGVAHPADLSSGANCQVFAYAILAHFGIRLPPLRSSELWVDTTYTSFASVPRPLDLLLFNRIDDSFGAHVALCVSEGRAVHLSRAVGYPVEWSIAEFMTHPEYATLIGAKRPDLDRSTHVTPFVS